MNAVAWTMKEIADFLVRWWPAVLILATIASLFYRYLWRPCYLRVTTFWQRLEDALDQVDKMDKAFGDNGGSSLADMIRSTNNLSRLTAARVSHLQNFIERPMFEANDKGIFTRVNRAFELLSGYSNADLVGHGWVNLVLPSDRARVIDEWEHAIEDRRSCVIDCQIKTRSYRVIQIQITAFPVVDDNTKELFSWLGELMLGRTIEAPK